MGTKYKYLRNLDRSDGTQEITLQGRPNLVMGGVPQELTEEEVARLQTRCVLLPEGAEEPTVPAAGEGETADDADASGELTEEQKAEAEKQAAAEAEAAAAAGKGGRRP